MLNRVIFLLGLALALLLPLGGSLQRERQLRAGRRLVLELAPVDPRSLMQGDYMALAYAMPPGLTLPASGLLVLREDEKGIARPLRLDGGAPLAPGETRVRFRFRLRRICIGSDAWFFQEGQGSRFAGARYGEFRVDAKGSPLLVGLLDAQLRPLGAEVR